MTEGLKDMLIAHGS